MLTVSMDDVFSAGKQAWPLTFTALKSIRDSSEEPVGFPAIGGINVVQHAQVSITTLQRANA